MAGGISVFLEAMSYLMRFSTIVLCLISISGSCFQDQRGGDYFLQAADSLVGFVAYDAPSRKRGVDSDTLRVLYGQAADAYLAEGAKDGFFIAKLRITWCYFIDNNIEGAQEVLRSIETDHPDLLEVKNDNLIHYYDHWAWSYFNGRALPKAIVGYQKVADLVTELGGEESPYLTKAYYFLGTSHQRMRSYQTAKRYMLKTLEQAERSGNRNFDLNCYNNLGIIYNNLGELQLALKYYNDVLNSLPVHNEFHGAIFFNLGSLLTKMGDYELAMQRFERGLELTDITRQGFFPIHGALFQGVGELYNKLGDMEKAEEFYLKSYNGYQSSERWRGRIGPPMFLAKFYYGNNRLQEADNYFRESYGLMKARIGENSVAAAEVEMYLGQIKSQKQDYDSALFYLHKSIESFTEQEVASIYDNPEVKSATQNPQRAVEAFFAKAETFALKYEDGENIADLRAAFDAGVGSIEIINQWRSIMTQEDSKIDLAGNTSQIFETVISYGQLLYDLTEDEAVVGDVFAIIEAYKAYNLLQAVIASGSLTTHSSVPDSLVERFDYLAAELKYFDQLTKNSTDSTALANAENETIRLNTDLEKLRLQMSAEYPEYHQARYSFNPINLSDLQKQVLNDNNLLVEYFVGAEQVYAVVATRDNSRLLTLSNTSEIEEEISKLLNGLRLKDFSQYGLAANNVFAEILEPVLTEVPGKSNLIIVPDGLIHYVAFDALLQEAPTSENYSSLAYLVKDYSVLNHYSAQLLTLNRAQISNDSRFIGFAPEFSQQVALATRLAADSVLRDQLQALPEAQNEVKAGADIFGGVSKIGDEASEVNFRNDNNYRIIHIATHTIIDNEDPLNSTLVFADPQDSTSDGLLHTYELYNLNLQANLVALSACNTGVGRYYKGEGVMSLARGFMYAGVPNVLMSLWAVNDRSTSEIMQAFYKHVDAGKTKEAALRQAKLDYLATADDVTANPYYWAPFVILGEVEEEESSVDSWWVVFPVLIVILIIIINNRRKYRYYKKRD